MKKFLLIFSFLGLFGSFFVRPVQAQNELLPAGQIIQSDYFRTGDQVQIDGDIEGDAFLAGGLVVVNGKVDGDLIIAGGKVNINGEVGNSIRVFGGDVTLNGPVGRNVLLVCGNCTVTKAASISGSLLISSANADVAAPVIGKGFRYFGGRLYLNSPITNEAFVVADQQFILGPQSSVSGDLKYTSSREVAIQRGATVAGKIAYQKYDKTEQFPRFFGASGVFTILDKLQPVIGFVGFLVSAFIGILLLGLFPKYFEKTAVAISKQPIASFGWGLLVLIMIPVLAVLLAITLVGLPVSLVLLGIGYLCFVIAQFAAAFVIGRKVLLARFGDRRGWAVVLGLFIFFILGFVPILGRIVYFALVITGLGGMVLAYRHKELVFLEEPAKVNPLIASGRKKKARK